MAERTETRGGRRTGAGRPAPDGARVTIAARVKATTRDALMSKAKGEGLSLGKYLDKISE